MREKVMRLATLGMPAGELMPPDFEPTGPREEQWPGFQSKYSAAAPAVNTLLQEKFVKKGIAIILPRSEAASIEGLNVHASGWAPKNNFPSGALQAIRRT
jgi:hypothetical protein